MASTRPGVAVPTWVCPSCGHDAGDRFCGHCGEERASALGDLGQRKGMHSFLTRMRTSLQTLASPPGRLTADWLAGKRVAYVAPLSLFLWVNVAFFLVQSATRLGILTWPMRVHLSNDLSGGIATRLYAEHRPFAATAASAYPAVFDALESVHAKSLVVIMVPAFALALAVLIVDRRRAFKDSLIFATHFYTFALIWLCALFPAVAIILHLIIAVGFALPSTHDIDLVVSSLETAMLAWYLYVALGTVFALTAPRRLATAAALVAALYTILMAYHLLVFAVTLYST
jgi:hypothetical protein